MDIEQNVSISNCLRNFSTMETLCGDQKYYCENCCSKQEAQKRMRIKKLPRLLALHLKRFKYVEQVNRYTKLSYRVLFPMELRVFNVVSPPLLLMVEHKSPRFLLAASNCEFSAMMPRTVTDSTTSSLWWSTADQRPTGDTTSRSSSQSARTRLAGSYSTMILST